MAENRPKQTSPFARGETRAGRRWRTGTMFAAGTAVLSVVLLLMTGMPIFTWLIGAALVALVVCVLADLSRPG